MREVGYPSREPASAPATDTFDGVVGAPALKLLCRSASVDGAQELYDAAAAACAGLGVELTHSSGSFGLLEISAAGVDKATALAAYCADLGIGADEVLALGDGFTTSPWSPGPGAVSRSRTRTPHCSPPPTRSPPPTTTTGWRRVLETLAAAGI